MPELWAENSLGRWNDILEICNLLKNGGTVNGILVEAYQEEDPSANHHI